MSKTVKVLIIVFLSIVVLCVIAVCISVPINMGKIKITAKFEDLELYTKRLPVYYRGFKLGRVTKVYLGSDSKTTNIDMRLKLRDAVLPDNVIAKIKTKNKKDFIDIEYPKDPSDAPLENGDVIQGLNSFDISSYIDKQADSGGLDELKDNLNNTISAAGETLGALTGLISIGTDILTDMRPSLKESSENIARTTKHLEHVAEKLSKSTNSKRFNNSTFNIEQTTANIELATRNLNLTAQNLSALTGTANTQTIANINNASFNLNCAMLQIRRILSVTENIVKGVKNTLSRKFAGFNIMFGRAIK